MASSSQQADAAIAELRRAYRDGLTRKGFTVADAAALALGGPLAVLGGGAVGDLFGAFYSYGSSLAQSPQQAAIEENMRQLQPRIEDWAGRRRAWAESSKREDGSSYDWGRWFDEGKALAGAVSFQTGEVYAASAFRVVLDTVAQSAADVKELGAAVAKPLGSLVENLHIVAVGAGAVAVAYVVWRFAR